MQITITGYDNFEQYIGIIADFDNGYFIVKHDLYDDNDKTETRIDLKGSRGSQDFYRMGFKLNKYQGVEILDHKNLSKILQKNNKYPHPNNYIECADYEWNIDRKQEYYIQAVNEFGGDHRYDHILQKYYGSLMDYYVKKGQFDIAWHYFSKMKEEEYAAFLKYNDDYQDFTWSIDKENGTYKLKLAVI